jgi:Rieske Fe-S protein
MPDRQFTDDRSPDDSIDATVTSPAREGLTGTAPANLYTSGLAADEVTIPPDGRPMERQPKWRRDFPIDSPQDQYIARRDFMKFLVLISAAFTAGQFWIGIQNWIRRLRGTPELRRIAELNQVPIGGAIAFSYPEETDRCLLIRPAADVLVAFSQQCTHLSCAVIPQPAQQRIYCPCHEGVFDLRSGRPIAGPPNRPLTRIALIVRDGAVYATGVELRTVT